MAVGRVTSYQGIDIVRLLYWFVVLKYLHRCSSALAIFHLYVDPGLVLAGKAFRR